MTSFFSNMGSRFGGGNKQGKGGNPKSPGSGPSSPAFPPTENMPPYGQRSDSPSSQQTSIDEPPKFFFQEKYAKLGVKGNFMPLAAQPKNVELGDWLAHQAFEQFGNIENLVACISELDGNTGRPLCNHVTCPVMSAGRSHTYTWLNSSKEPVKVPAYQYIGLVRRWIQGKLSDTRTFPTEPLAPSAATYASGNVAEGDEAPIPAGPTSLSSSLPSLSGRSWVGKSAGFPENFFTDVRTIFRQIFRIYAHIYHSHWVNPFWHIHNTSPPNPSSGWTDLNSCFVHFVTVAKLFGLLSDKDLEPMQPLVDIWIQNGSIPADAANGACAVPPQQAY